MGEVCSKGEQRKSQRKDRNVNRINIQSTIKKSARRGRVTKVTEKVVEKATLQQDLTVELVFPKPELPILGDRPQGL